MTVASKTALSPRRRAYDRSLRTLLYVCAGITVALLVFLIGYIFYRGLSNISWSLLTSETSYISDTIGILPNFLNTLYIILLAMVIVLPLGVGAAIYLTEYATNRRLVAVIEFATETLTGIPSIIFGLVGMLFFLQLMGLKAGILAGGLTLVIMILPTIITVSKTSLDAVPDSYYEGSLALGATHERSVFYAVLPAAKSGVLSAVILGIGRAIGETMAVVMVAGNQTWMPKGLFQGLRTMTSNIVIEMGYAADLHREALIATGVVLFVFILLINLCFSLVKGGKDYA